MVSLHRRAGFGTALLAVAAIVVTSCTPPADQPRAEGTSSPTATAAATETGTASATPDGPAPILIGAAMADSGLARRVDRPALAAAVAEVERINAAGGIDGRMVELRVLDTETELNATYGAARDLLEAGAVALLVTCDFDFAQPALEVAASFGATVMSPCGSDPRWNATDAYSAGAGADAEGRLLADVLLDRATATAAVVIDDGDAEMEALCEAFRRRFSSGGGRVVGELVYDATLLSRFSPDVLEPEPDLAPVAAADAVVLCGSLPTTGPRVVQILRERGIDAPLVTGSAMAGTDWIRDDVGDLTFLSWGSTFRNDPSEEVNAIVEGVRATIGGSAEGGRMVAGADAMVALLRAVERGGEDLGAALEAMAGEELAVATASWGAGERMLDDRPIRVMRVVDGEGVVTEVRVAP